MDLLLVKTVVPSQVFRRARIVPAEPTGDCDRPPRWPGFRRRPHAGRQASTRPARSRTANCVRHDKRPVDAAAFEIVPQRDKRHMHAIGNEADLQADPKDSGRAE